jgi:hypothetical protein
MEKTYKTEFGAFTLDTAHNQKIASRFEAVVLKNWPQLDHKNLWFRVHRPWLRQHISNHGWNRTRSENPTPLGGHLVEFASRHLRL